MRTLYFITLFIIGCSGNSKENYPDHIKGNWCFFDGQYYNEVYITDTTILFYNEIIEFYGPFKYKLLDDSLRIYCKDTSGSFIYKDAFYFSYENSDTIKMFFNNLLVNITKLKDSQYNLGSVHSVSDYNKYFFLFHKRRNYFLFQMGFDVDTSLNLVPGEAIEMLP